MQSDLATSPLATQQTVAVELFQGVPVTEIAERFGTPLYVYDGAVITDTYQALRAQLPREMEVFYSFKANPNVSVVRLLRSLGSGAEVSSISELETALRAGHSPQSIIFLGPGKRKDELERAAGLGILAIVVESFEELAAIGQLGASLGRAIDVALRVNPTFKTRGTGLTMGGKPRQFGIDEAYILRHASRFAAVPNIRLVGVHAYMGTRFLEEETVIDNTARILEMAERVADAVGFRLRVVDVGGGLGVPYFEGEREICPRRLGAGVSAVVAPFAARHPDVRLIMELGRYLVAKSGVLVSRVLYRKESQDKTFLVTDGGTNCHMAAVGIGSFVKRNFPMLRLAGDALAQRETVSVSGPLCTPNDLIGTDVELVRAEPGDLIGVLNSGAYGASASPVLFLSHGHPAEVMVHRGHALLIRERDQPRDILAKQIMVDINPAGDCD